MQESSMQRLSIKIFVFFILFCQIANAEELDITFHEGHCGKGGRIIKKEPVPETPLYTYTCSNPNEENPNVFQLAQDLVEI